MGWETRERGGCYYYRKERDGSRVRSVYVGRGQTAGLISRLDGLKQSESEEARAERPSDALETLAARLSGVELKGFRF